MLRWYSTRIAFVAAIVGMAVAGISISDMIFPEFTGEFTIKGTEQLAIVSVYSFA
jgi:hypothetical protein